MHYLDIDPAARLHPRVRCGRVAAALPARETCVDMLVDMCVDMCVDNCVDMRVDMCVDM